MTRSGTGTVFTRSPLSKRAERRTLSSVVPSPASWVAPRAGRSCLASVAQPAPPETEISAALGA